MEVLLTREADRAMFKMVYPFSPALIQALVAVSSALQRERTALKIMLQLLVNRRDTLRLGDVIPLGDLWDVVAHGDEAFTDVMRVNFENAKKLYQNKLLPMLEQQHEIDLEVDRERAKTNAEIADKTPAVRERRPAREEPAAVRPGPRRRDAEEHDLPAAGRTEPRDDPLPHSGPGTSGRRPEAADLGGHGRRDSSRARIATNPTVSIQLSGRGYRGDHRGGQDVRQHRQPPVQDSADALQVAGHPRAGRDVHLAHLPVARKPAVPATCCSPTSGACPTNRCGPATTGS